MLGTLRKLLDSLLRPGRTRGGVQGGDTAGSEGGGAAACIRRAEALARDGRLEAALECYRACVRHHPAATSAYLGMGNTLVDLWAIEDALAAYEEALALAPDSAAIFSAILFHSHYRVPADPQWLFGQHRRFGNMMRKATPPGNAEFTLQPDPARRIRIGYLSANFSRHSVGYFVEPVIRHHDRRRYEIFCYYNHPLADETTARMRRDAAVWRDVADATDDAVERLIRDDGIDILVDLAGHSKGNRLGVFARKPAPIQMTWLGYPGTTGLEAVDFRITDAVADPAPDAQLWHTEQLLRIDDLFLCYQPAQDSPPVSTRDGAVAQVVFCSFNNIAKLNREMIRVWAGILAAVPGSRIVLKSAALTYSETRDRVLECFESQGVDAQRVDMQGWISDRNHHLEFYSGMDIALDTFPYNGTTTTCEALWMGVPVVSLAGNVHMSRVGATLLKCAGLRELVAGSTQDYADLAIALAHDQPRRAALRASLRDRLRSSPLLDHAGFTAKLERLYRQSWQAWCELGR